MCRCRGLAVGLIAAVIVLGVSSASPAGAARRAAAAHDPGQPQRVDATAATWQPTPPLVFPQQYQATALLRDGRVLATGGAGREPGPAPGAPFAAALAAAERYDPATDRWTLVAPLGRARAFHTATALADGTVLVVGGHGATPDPAAAETPATAERYDPATDRWSALPGPQAGRVEHTATLLPDGRVLVVGGIGVGGERALGAEIYDPAAGRWRATAPPPSVPLTRNAATLLADGTVLVTGGTTPPPPTCQGGGCTLGTTAAALRYDPVADRWTAVAPMTSARAGHTATLLPDGSVLVVGGGQAERYDPRADRWTPTAAQPAGHAFDHTATALPDGSVLVAGGGDRGGVPYTTAADRYDPVGDRWTAAGTLQAARSRHTATRLLDGRVLVAGGYGLGPDTAEVFTDPALQPSACFAETDRCLTGRFLAYWTANGGLARNGFPLSEERQELLEDGNTYTVQYFERVRLEYHPENLPPYDVLLGQFGRRVLSERFTTDRSGYERAVAPVPAAAGQSYFPATGHNLGGAFLAYWQANGGLAQFGYPLTEAFRETLDDQRDYQVQYFERGRLELHPENAAPYGVLLGQFGRAILAEADLLGGELGRLYLADAGVRDRLGRPLRAAPPTAAAMQPFERGRMVYLDRAPFRGQVGRFILVLVGDPGDGRVLDNFATLEPYFVDTWAEGQPAGGGPGPGPGLSEPTRGFGQVWRDNDRSGVREALGYATAPEAGYTATAQEFERGLMLTADTPEGRFIYVIDVRRISNGSAPAAAYQRYPAPPR